MSTVSQPGFGNRRLLIMTDHYSLELTACSPVAGWEEAGRTPGSDHQGERLFKPCPRFASPDGVNAWLEAECRCWVERNAYPDLEDATIAQALEMEQAVLQLLPKPFDGFFESECVASWTCLVIFDRSISVKAMPNGPRGLSGR
jgi:hypothetical protein